MYAFIITHIKVAWYNPHTVLVVKEQLVVESLAQRLDAMVGQEESMWLFNFTFPLRSGSRISSLQLLC